MSNNIDCACCGDRWYPCNDRWDGEDVPNDPTTVKWMGENPEAYIHYLDGRVESK